MHVLIIFPSFSHENGQQWIRGIHTRQRRGTCHATSSSLKRSSSRTRAARSFSPTCRGLALGRRRAEKMGDTLNMSIWLGKYQKFMIKLWREPEESVSETAGLCERKLFNGTPLDQCRGGLGFRPLTPLDKRPPHPRQKSSSNMFASEQLQIPLARRGQLLVARLGSHNMSQTSMSFHEAPELRFLADQSWSIGQLWAVKCLEIRILQKCFLLVNCIQFPGTFPVNNFTSHILVESHLEVYYDVHPT